MREASAHERVLGLGDDAAHAAEILGELGSQRAHSADVAVGKVPGGGTLERAPVRPQPLLAWKRRVVGQVRTEVEARPVFAGYLVGVGLAAGLMSAAAYWGGEMMIAR